MALSLIIKKTAINSDGTKITIQDQTGNYDASTNPGGYGSPNDARNAVALFLRAYGKRYNKTETLTSTLLTVTPDNEDKTLVTGWEVTILEKDSWIQATIYALRLYSTSTSFEIGELTYDTSTAQIRKILTKSGSGPYTYTYDVVEEADLETESNIKRALTVYNTFAIPNSCECHEKANSVWQKSILNKKSTLEADWKRYYTIDALLKGIKYSFGYGSYAEGQKLIEWVEDLCNCLDQECGC